MHYHYNIIAYNLVFKKPAKTSRNSFTDKTVYFLKLYNLKEPKVFGIGEAAPLALLSIDDLSNFSEVFNTIVEQFCETGHLEPLWSLQYPAMFFAIETALNDLKNGGKRIVYPAALNNQIVKIKINGLVWMNETSAMLEEAFELVEKGYDCIKFKVGALDFDAECRMLEKFRKRYNAGNFMLRLDANGAFHPNEVKEQLRALKKYTVHSIEQPLKPIFVEELAELCATNTIAIALDESLIGVGELSKKQQLLKDIQPQYIVLKPTLLGGLNATQEWITLSNEFSIGNWITSALESNIGLNAIAQFCVTQPFVLHNYQGLGTGSLFENNIDSPWKAEAGELIYSNDSEWNLSQIQP